MKNDWLVELLIKLSGHTMAKVWAVNASTTIRTKLLAMLPKEHNDLQYTWNECLAEVKKVLGIEKEGDVCRKGVKPKPKKKSAKRDLSSIYSARDDYQTGSYTQRLIDERWENRHAGEKRHR